MRVELTNPWSLARSICLFWYKGRMEVEGIEPTRAIRQQIYSLPRLLNGLYLRNKVGSTGTAPIRPGLQPGALLVELTSHKNTYFWVRICTLHEYFLVRHTICYSTSFHMWNDSFVFLFASTYSATKNNGPGESRTRVSKYYLTIRLRNRL